MASPEQSEADSAITNALDEITNRLRDLAAGSRIEVEIYRPLSPDEIDGLVTFGAALEPNDGWWEYRDIARVRRTRLVSSNLSLIDQPGAEVGLPVSSLDDGAAFVFVGAPLRDDRARRVFNDEYHHFCAAHANLLIPDVARAGNALVDWAPSLVRLFQPSRNRRVGAVILFDQAIVRNTLRRRWRVLANRFAFHPPPALPLDGFTALHQPW